jgi:hypothetical protein
LDARWLGRSVEESGRKCRLLEKGGEGEKVSGVVGMKRLKGPNTSSSTINRETDS